MKLFLKFFASVAVWTAVLLTLLSGVSIVGGQSLSSVFSHLPVWGGLALVLSAFPAGIAVAGEVFPRRSVISFRMFGAFAASAVTLALLTFVLVGYAGPAAVRAVGPKDSGAGVVEPSTLTIGALKAEARRAAEEVESQVGMDGRTMDWLETNILVWHYVRRLAAVAQPPLFAAIGLLLGFWGLRLGKRELVQVMYWATGLFLVVSTYLAGENSFELIVLKAAGPVFFSGFFVLLIPPVLVLGLAIPTVIMLLTARDEMAEV